jgi:hypothetical protein
MTSKDGLAESFKNSKSIEASITKLNNPVAINPSMLKPVNLQEPYMASSYYERLIEYIVEFEDTLSDREEVGMKLVSFGETIVIHVDDLGYYNPRLICFVGRDNNGNRAQLIQHVNQISFLLIALKREKDRPRIGYKLSEKLKEKETD